MATFLPIILAAVLCNVRLDFYDSHLTHNAVRKNLKLYPYKVTCYHELKEADYEKRVQYCRWFRQLIDDDDEQNILL